MALEIWAAALSMKVGDPRAKLVYQALCNRADPDGRNAWPSIAYLAERAECSERTVVRKLEYLLEHGLIREGDQHFVDHLRADRRPVVYDVALDPATRTAWAEAGTAAPRRSQAAAAGARRRASAPADKATEATVDPSRGDTVVSGRRARGDKLTPREPQVKRGDKLTPRSPRGDKPGSLSSYRPIPPPPTPSNGSRETVGAVGARPEEAEAETTGTSEDVSAAADLAAALPGRLTAGQRHRLVEPIAARLAAGWSVEALKTELTVDLDGVRHFHAVYRHRLDDLPDAPPTPRAGERDEGPALGGPAHPFEADPADPETCRHCPRPRRNRVHTRQTAPEAHRRTNNPEPAPGSGSASSRPAQVRSGRRGSARPLTAGEMVGTVLSGAEASGHVA
ncbi:helix-turn-helix domain-containing protein [Glycomyces halotolerans]